MKTILKNKTTLLCLVLFSSLLVACGKEGMPKPRPSLRDFAWQDVSAEKQGDCLVFTGTFEGAHQNLDQIRLELAPLDNEQNCATCPFLPREIVLFSTRQAHYDQSIGRISFSYCPQKSPAYRWRLTGLSIYSKIPHSVSPIKVTVMEEDIFTK